MSTYGENGGNGGGNGGPADDDFDDLIRDPLDDFDDLIRDPDYDFDDPPTASGWEDPSAAYARFGGRSGNGSSGSAGESTAESIARLIELVGGLASEALPPDTRRQVERMLRDLLVVLRDTFDRLIDRLDEHDLDDEIEIEEIRID